MGESACRRTSANVQKDTLVYAANSVSISDVRFEESFLLREILRLKKKNLVRVSLPFQPNASSLV